jgi:hypothetical protein
MRPQKYYALHPGTGTIIGPLTDPDWIRANAVSPTGWQRLATAPRGQKAIKPSVARQLFFVLDQPRPVRSKV